MGKGEVGICGVAISSLKDMEVLLDGIPLDKVTTSMTINGPAAMLLAMYVAVGDEQGVSREKLGGTTQNDNLKEYFAQKLCIYPPKSLCQTHHGHHRVLRATLAKVESHKHKRISHQRSRRKRRARTRIHHL